MSETRPQTRFKTNQESLQHTNGEAAVLHQPPVFQIHGPHVAVEEAGGVGDSVLPGAAQTSPALEVHAVANMRFYLPSPSSSFALVVGNGDVVTLVEDLQQGPERGTKDAPLHLLLNTAFCTGRINKQSSAATQIGSYQRSSRPCWVHRVPAAGPVIGAATQSPFRLNPLISDAPHDATCEDHVTPQKRPKRARRPHRQCGTKDVHKGTEKGLKGIGNLRVVIEQEAFHNQDVCVPVGVARISCRGEINAMGTGELHRVLHPALNRVGHCLHVQGCDHCGARAQSNNKKFRRKTLGRLKYIQKDVFGISLQVLEEILHVRLRSHG